MPEPSKNGAYMGAAEQDPSTSHIYEQGRGGAITNAEWWWFGTKPSPIALADWIICQQMQRHRNWHHQPVVKSVTLTRSARPPTPCMREGTAAVHIAAPEPEETQGRDDTTHILTAAKAHTQPQGILWGGGDNKRPSIIFLITKER